MQELEELLESVGLGNQVPQIVARRLVPEEEGILDKLFSKRNAAAKGIAIRGTEGLVVSYARCCRPLPGDDIMGHLSAGRGIVVHRQKCRNISTELRASPDKCLPLRWSDKIDREFQSELRIALVNQRGLLATIASVVTDSNANIEHISIEEKGSHHGVMQLGLLVKDRIHLAQIIKRIRVLTGVDKVIRVKA